MIELLRKLESLEMKVYKREWKKIDHYDLQTIRSTIQYFKQQIDNQTKDKEFYTILLKDLENFGYNGLIEKQNKAIKKLIMEKITYR